MACAASKPPYRCVRQFRGWTWPCEALAPDVSCSVTLSTFTSWPPTCNQQGLLRILLRTESMTRLHDAEIAPSSRNLLFFFSHSCNMVNNFVMVMATHYILLLFILSLTSIRFAVLIPLRILHCNRKFVANYMAHISSTIFQLQGECQRPSSSLVLLCATGISWGRCGPKTNSICKLRGADWNGI